MPIQKLSPNFEAQVGIEANNYQYNNKELNEDFGLHWSHHEYRFLDLQINRWTSIDPLAEKNNNISGYSFVHNNPIKYRDPYGLDSVLATFVVTAKRVDKSSMGAGIWKAINSLAGYNANRIRDQMNLGHRRMLSKTGGHYNPIKFGPRNTSGIGDYAYQKGLGVLSYPITATLAGAGLALFAPAMPPLLEQSSLSIYGIKAITSGSAQAIITGEIDIPDLLGDTFLTPIYSGIVGGTFDGTYSLITGDFNFQYYGLGGTKSGSDFLIDFGFSSSSGLYGNASESMFKSFIATEAKTTPLFLFPMVTSPVFSGINYGGSTLTKTKK